MYYENNPMVELMNYQHGQGGMCSFDCGRCGFDSPQAQEDDERFAWEALTPEERARFEAEAAEAKAINKA